VSPDSLQAALEALASRNVELDLLRSVATTLLSFESTDQLFDEIARVAKDLLRADGGAVFIAAAEGRVLRVVAAEGLLAPARGRLIPIEGSFAGSVVTAATPLVTEDLSADPRNHPVDGLPAELARAVVVPLTSKGEIIGAIASYNRADGGPFTEDDVHLLQALAEQVTIGLDRAALLLEARRNEALLQEKNAELQEVTKLKDRFLANMSHELRTPLNAIIGFSDLMVDEPALDPAHREYVEAIARNGRHLMLLINELLDFSKAEAGRLVPRLERFDLRGAVSAAVQDTESLRKAKRHRCVVNLAETELLVLADERQIRQVLFNLLSNASKFTPPDGSVTLSAKATRLPLPVAKRGDVPELETRDAVWVAVQDTGIGIRALDLPRLFQPFEQLDGGTARREPGTGLGLALSKQLIEVHGGAIGVESDPDRGSLFWFVLPADGPRRP
jgi:signal transduction histidine kinase